jgi:ATP-dependent DNA ligase
MSQTLTQYVANNYAKIAKMDLARWLQKNPPPVICEPKWDGYRVFLFKSRDKVVLASKYGRVYTASNSPKLFSKIPKFKGVNKLILDCEVVLSKDLLFPFDVLHVKNKDVRKMPLEKRKKLLGNLLDGTGSQVEFVYAHNLEEILEYKDRKLKENYEGIVLKNPASSYGQSNSWLKLKKFNTVDCFVTSVEKTPDMKRTGIPHSWFIGVYDERGEVLNTGKVGTFLKEIDPSLVKVGTVVEVQCQEVTKEKQLRAPFIIKIREDKTPRECDTSQLQTENTNN